MIGKKFNKPLPNEETGAYSQAAKWCNENGAMIVERDSYYEVIAIPEPTPAEKLATAEAKRNSMLAETDWYVIRASEPDGKPVPEEILAYRQALRELDQHPDWPDVTFPVLSEPPVAP